MAVENITIELAPGKEISIETGKIANLAHGAVVVRTGDTSILVTACHSDPRPGMDFFPLTVDYREKFSAAGRIPGGFFKREGRPSEKEILTARMTDRPLRPLFPKGFIDEVQICSLLLSCDGQNDSDVLSMFGASVALTISDIPFQGPIGACRVGRIDGQFVANPTHAEMEKSDLDLVYAGIEDKTIMIEGGCDELTEEQLRDALSFANDVVKKQIAAQRELQAKIGKEKYTPSLVTEDDDIKAAVSAAVAGKLGPICLIGDKTGRGKALDAVKEEIIGSLVSTLANDTRGEDEVTEQVKRCLTNEFQAEMRNLVLEQGKRMDGRGAEDLRPLAAEVGVLPRVHGSALFTRGETQGMVLTTLGTAKDNQEFDGITGGPTSKDFVLHYNFPNYSVGECGRIMGPGRREIGHGNLAERCIARMMPRSEEEFPYFVRCVSEIMSSNGSTSMASICAGSLALMDAGVPLKKAVAGISCGLVTADEGDKYVMLTDIIGAEDHYGDMDFKVAGTRDGITGFQLDLKIAGISIDMMYEAMLRDKTARMAILDVMDSAIATPRESVSEYAPQIHTMMINPEKIGALIGPGGSNIREITASCDVEINIEDDGTVLIYANSKEKRDAAIERVNGVVAEIEVDKIYRGTVVSIKDFGAFIEVLPGQDGLLHISEIADYRVNNVEDELNVGDKVTVKCIDIDSRGRVRLSRKAALKELE